MFEYNNQRQFPVYHMAIELKGRIFFLLLMVFLAQACLDPLQKDGRCSKCLPAQNLQNGTCYSKIRGCLKQTANSCTQCQDGYVKDNEDCTRYADYFNLTNLAPSIIKIQDSRLSSADIMPVMAGGFQQTTNFNSPAYAQAKATLIKEYPALANMKVYKVEEQVVNGMNYLFYIINTENYDLYLAKVYVTFKMDGSVTEIYKNDASILKFAAPIQGPQPLPGLWRQLTTFNDTRYTESLELVLKTYNGIDKYNLQKSEYQVVAGMNFLFYFTGLNSEKFTIQVYKPFFGSAVVKNEWGTRPTVQSSVTQTQSPLAGAGEIMPSSEYDKEPFLSVVKVIQKDFPTFTVAQIKKVQRQIVAGWNLIVTFSLPNSKDVYELQVFVPLAYTGNSPEIQSAKKNGVAYTLSSSISEQTIPKSQSISPIVGGYSDVANLNSPFYIQAKADLLKQYTELSAVTLVKSQQQIVNGVNYMFYFSNQQTGDRYIAQVYVDLGLKTTVNTVFKNDQSIKNGQNKPQEQVAPKVGAWEQFTDLADARLVASQNALLSEYPALSNYKLVRVESQIVSGMNFRFFFQEKTTKQSFTAQIYYPFSGKPEITDTWGNLSPTSKTVASSSEVTSIQAGGREPILQSQFGQQPYLGVKSAIKKIFPAFDDTWVKKAQKQVVAGWNVFVTFSSPKSTDIYDIIIFVPLPYTEDPPQITSIMKNGITYEPQISVSSSQPSTLTNAKQIITGGFSSNVDQANPLFIEAKSTLFKEYSFLSGFDIKKIQGQIVSGMNYVFTIVDSKTKDQYVARVYVTLSKQGSVEEISKNGVSIKRNSTTTTDQPIMTGNVQPSSTVDDLLAGGWQSVPPSEYVSEPFLSIQAQILTYFPTFTTSLIKKAAKQVVAGWNYVIAFTLPNSSDSYEVKVFIPLSYTGKGPSISQANKNGLPFSVSPTKIQPTYNYQTDSTFTELYKFFKSEVKISNLLPVADVSRQLKTLPGSQTKYYEYNITFSSDEYAICRWYQDFNVFEVISYIADKNELYQLASKLSTLPFSRTQSVLTEKIKDYDPKRFGRVLIRDITQIKLSQYVRIFKMNAYAASGHYNMTILDRGQLFVIQVQFADSQRGFVIKTNVAVQYRQQYIIDQIKIFLFSKYSLSGYDLTLAVVNALDLMTNQYVILLARDDLKKLKVSVQETNGTFAIKKQQILNNGLYVVSDTVVQKVLDDVARKEFSAGLNGFDRVLVFTNGTLNVVIYANDSSISTYTNNTVSKLSDVKNKSFAKAQNCQTFQTNTKLCSKCSQGDTLFKGKCYKKLLNCAFQVGSECLSCDKWSMQVKGNCLKSYSTDLFI